MAREIISGIVRNVWEVRDLPVAVTRLYDTTTGDESDVLVYAQIDGSFVGRNVDIINEPNRDGTGFTQCLSYVVEGSSDDSGNTVDVDNDVAFQHLEELRQRGFKV